jgi:membrane dipeptidase
MPEKIVDELFDYRRHGRDFTGFEGLSRSGLDLVIDNLGDGEGLITSLHGWKWDETIYDIGMRLCDLAHQDFVRVVRHLGELESARSEGQVGIALGIESAAPIENELDRLDILYGLGVRSVGISYNGANHLGSGLGEAVDGGLTSFGHRAVERMNQLGMLIDLSHAGDQTSLDTIRASKAPVCISHAGARTLWPTRRMKPDDVLRALADGGGVIGIEAAPNTTVTRTARRHTLDSIMEHFEYCVNLIGIDHVGFGPDTTFGDHVGFHHAVVDWFGAQAPATSEQFEAVEWVDGVESPAESFPNIVRWLVTHGYSDEDIIKAVGGNIHRLLEATWDDPIGR